MEKVEKEEKLVFHSANVRRIDEALVTGAVIGTGLTFAAVSPSFANDGPTQVNTMVTSVGTAAAGAITVLLVAMGVRLAVTSQPYHG